MKRRITVFCIIALMLALCTTAFALELNTSHELFYDFWTRKRFIGAIFDIVVACICFFIKVEPKDRVRTRVIGCLFLVFAAIALFRVFQTPLFVTELPDQVPDLPEQLQPISPDAAPTYPSFDWDDLPGAIG